MFDKKSLPVGRPLRLYFNTYYYKQLTSRVSLHSYRVHCDALMGGKVSIVTSP